MSFFHQNGYKQAVTALQEEKQVAVERIAAELKVAANNLEVERLRQELVQVETGFQERQQQLLNCLF